MYTTAATVRAWTASRPTSGYKLQPIGVCAVLGCSRPPLCRIHRFDECYPYADKLLCIYYRVCKDAHRGGGKDQVTLAQDWQLLLARYIGTESMYRRIAIALAHSAD